jgi:hypothetical protein
MKPLRELEKDPRICCVGSEYRRRAGNGLKTLAMLSALIACAANSPAQSAQTATPTKAVNLAPTPAQSKPEPKMRSGQSGGTLLQAPKSTSQGTLMTVPQRSGSDVERMSHDQFRALSDTAIVRYRGVSMSKAAFIQQRFREWGSPSSPEARKPALSFEAIKAQFQQKQSSDLQAQNARVQAVINRLNLHSFDKRSQSYSAKLCACIR